MTPKEFRALDAGGIHVRDKWRLEPELRKKKYQVNIKLRNGRMRYLYLNNPDVAELYVKVIRAKILKIIKL